MLHEEWVKENKSKFNKLTVSFTALKNCEIRGSTWGETGRWCIVTENVRVNFTFDSFHGGCGIGMLYKYQVTNYRHQASLDSGEKEEVKNLIDSVMSFLGQYCNKGAFIACCPMVHMHSVHFLELGGFVPLISWGNPLHNNRGLHLWIKHLNEPYTNENKSNIYTYGLDRALSESLITDKLTLVQKLNNELHEVKTQLKELELKRESTESVKS